MLFAERLDLQMCAITRSVVVRLEVFIEDSNCGRCGLVANIAKLLIELKKDKL